VEYADTIGTAIVSGIGGIIVAAIGAWALIYSNKRKAKSKPPENSHHVFDELMERLDSARQESDVLQNRIRKIEAENARLRAENRELKSQRTGDHVLIARLRTSVDESKSTIAQLRATVDALKSQGHS